MMLLSASSDEDDADERQQEPLAGHERDDGEAGAERERAGIAHEHPRRMGVVPEEAEVRAGDDEREGGDEFLALDEPDDPVGDERDERRTAGEAIEAVGDSDGAGGGDDDERRDRDVEEHRGRSCPT